MTWCPWVLLAATAAPLFGQTRPVLEFGTHKWLDWAPRGGCVVELAKTPCRTVETRDVVFNHNVRDGGLYRISRLHAVAEDGSEATFITEKFRPLWWFVEQTRTSGQMVLHKQNRIISLDPGRRIYAEETGGRHLGVQTWEEDDRACSHARSHYLYLSMRLPDSVVAGFPVVRYGGEDDSGAEYEVDFAPSLGCQSLRFSMIRRGLLGWPTTKHLLEVVSYKLGPPSPDLFAVPRGFRQVSRDKLHEAMTARPFFSW
jgi:hypothetical protein